MHTLPIVPLLPALRQTLAAACNAVLQAPPGAGKTTRVPLALLDADWLGDRKIIVLEPRRLAARAAARFMARSLGERVGETVGYRVRLDASVGPRTRIEVVTEGILTRRLQDDPALEDVGLVVFDEFHERSLQADLGLALCLDTQGVLRPDLRLLVMSATLDGASVARLLGEAPLLTSAGRGYEVDIRYRPIKSRTHVNAAGSARRPRAQCLACWVRKAAVCWCFCPARVKSARWKLRCGQPIPARRSCSPPCMASSPQRSRTLRFSPLPLDGARWCSPRQLPRPV